MATTGRIRPNENTDDENDYGNLATNKQTRYLSTIMDMSSVESIKTIETDENGSKIFVETSRCTNAEVEDNMRDSRMKPEKRRKKKITIISKKKHRDGSVETSRQEIYKNYGHGYAKE